MTEFQQIVINLVNEGRTVSEIAKLLGRNASSVSSVVKRLFIQRCYYISFQKERENRYIY